MSPKRRTLLSLVFACICISKSLLIRISKMTTEIFVKICWQLKTPTQSDLKVHALHYANKLLVRVRLSFQRLSQTHHSICRNNTKKCLGKELWLVLVVSESADHDKPHFDLFSTTISTSKKMSFLYRARAEKGIARHIDTSSAVWLGPSNFWLARSEHAHASYPGLCFRPPGFSSYMEREERKVQGLD